MYPTTEGEMWYSARKVASLPPSKVLNPDVKSKILRLVQNWAIAFEGKPLLPYAGQVYRTLKSEGM